MPTPHPRLLADLPGFTGPNTYAAWPVWSDSARRPGPNTRVTRGHFDQRQSKMAVAEHVAAILRFATDLCDTENGGIPWGLVLSRNS
jgi:hypothetical protein